MEEHTGWLWCCCRRHQVNPLPLSLGGLQEIDAARRSWSGLTMGRNCSHREEEKRTRRRGRLRPAYRAVTRVTSWMNTVDRGNWQQQNNWTESAVSARNPRSCWFRGAAQAAAAVRRRWLAAWRREVDGCVLGTSNADVDVGLLSCEGRRGVP